MEEKAQYNLINVCNGGIDLPHFQRLINRNQFNELGMEDESSCGVVYKI